MRCEDRGDDRARDRQGAQLRARRLRSCCNPHTRERSYHRSAVWLSIGATEAHASKYRATSYGRMRDTQEQLGEMKELLAHVEVAVSTNCN